MLCSIAWNPIFLFLILLFFFLCIKGFLNICAYLSMEIILMDFNLELTFFDNNFLS